MMQSQKIWTVCNLFNIKPLNLSFLLMLDEIVSATNPSMSLYLVWGMPSLETSGRQNHWLCSKRCWSLTFIKKLTCYVFIFCFVFPPLRFDLDGKARYQCMYVCMYVYVYVMCLRIMLFLAYQWLRTTWNSQFNFVKA